MDKCNFIKNWRRRWLFCLFELSHLSFQRKLWIESAFPDIKGDFDEGMCQYFIDLGFDDNYANEIEKEYISEEEYNTIKIFHELLSGYDDGNKTDSEILIDSKWIEISEIGLKTWGKLKGDIKDKEEINFIQSIESEYLTYTQATTI